MVILTLCLCKIRISALASMAFAAGYILVTDSLAAKMLWAVFSFFLLACGSCALNEYQERDIDALMDRTKNRPIPSGRMKPVYALYIAIFLITAGSLLLLISANKTAFGLGIFAAFWYNAVYTYLKKITAFAAVPGALIGAIAPLAGWTAGGRSPLDKSIFPLAFFLFVWQIPHFWLILLKYESDYEKSGLPALTRVISKEKLSKITFALMVVTVAISLFGIIGYVI